MAGNSKAIVLTDEVSLTLGAIGAIGIDGVSNDDFIVITQCGLLGGKLPFENASFDFVIAIWKNTEELTDTWIGGISRILKPGAGIYVQTCSLSTEQVKPSSVIERKLLISGFVEIQAVQDSKSNTIKGKKASWTTGSSFPIKKSTKILPKIQISDESDLIDEDSLLTEDDLKRPQLPVVGDCEVGSTRKACKNCTCGRAEAEQKVEKLELTAEQINNPQSACGNCGLGDAFRCSSCPYRGLAPFKLGEKVSLSGDFLAADI